MKTITIGKKIKAPEIGLGCMRLNSLDLCDAETLVRTALENDVNFFDHADIYAGGEAERLFARVVRQAGIPRDNMIIQSKCGIRPGCCYDFSKAYILQSTEGILRRLQMDYLDILLLHRPDTLMEPEEVAEAFRWLKESGKVRHFGVSNHNPGQIQLISRYLDEPISINQLQFSITNCGLIDAGINVNMMTEAAVNRDGGVLEYCRLQDITIQAWSPFQYGFFEGVFIDSPIYPELNHVLAQIAERYGISKTTLAIAWILRHPAHIQPIVGTTSPQRLAEICAASEILLTREEWYAIYLAAGKKLP